MKSCYLSFLLFYSNLIKSILITKEQTQIKAIIVDIKSMLPDIKKYCANIVIIPINLLALSRFIYIKYQILHFFIYF